MINFRLCVYNVPPEERADFINSLNGLVAKHQLTVLEPAQGEFCIEAYDLKSEKEYVELQAVFTPLVSDKFFQFFVYQRSGANLKVGDVVIADRTITVVAVGNNPPDTATPLVDGTRTDSKS